MACSCNQKAVPPTGSAAARAAADRADALAKARAANPSVNRIGPSKTSTGEAQTFAMIPPSQLERVAAAARAANSR